MARNWLILSVFFIVACSSERVDFNTEAWALDTYGCNGVRITMLDQVKSIKDDLKGRSSESIDDLFGKPDLTDLDKRHKLYYYYYLSGGEKCETSNGEKVYLQIRFNAINRADELIIFQSALSN